MNYKLSKIKYGTGKTSVITNLSIPDSQTVNDICYIEGVGIAFIYGNQLGLADFSGKVDYSFISNLNKPLSLFYSEQSHRCYIFENGGRSLRYFTRGFDYLMPFLGDEYSRLMKKDLRMLTDDIETIVRGCVDYYEEIYATHNFLNRCIRFRGSEYSYFAGNGKYGEIVSSELLSSNFSGPQGISFLNGELYVSDTGNNCIKKILKGKMDMFLNNVKMPSKMVAKNKLIYFISNTVNICYLSLDKSSNCIFSSNNLVSIDMDNNKNLFILEKE